MKQFIIRNIIVIILSLPVLTALGQNQDNVPYVYGYDVDFVSSVPTADNVYQIQLYSLSDELTFRKKSDIGKDSLEKIIYSLIPDAQIRWNNRPTDLCSVISEKGNLDDVVEKMMKEEAVSFVSTNVDESEIIWENDSICTVLTHPQNVDAAMNAIIQDNSVLHVSHKYLNVNSYEKTIGDGLKNPESFGLNGKISVSFKDDITETEKKLFK